MSILPDVIYVRPWGPEDGEVAAGVVRAVFEEYGFSWDEGDYCADLYDVQGHYLDRGHLFWLAEFEGRVIGTGALELFAPIGSEVLGLGSGGDSDSGSDLQGRLTPPQFPTVTGPPLRGEGGENPHPLPPLPNRHEHPIKERGGTALIDGKIRVLGADCSLERLYVHPEARGLGAGSALFLTTIEEARRRGRTVMEIWSDKKLENAHRLYGHFGAEVVGERICDDPDESPEWGLRLLL